MSHEPKSRESLTETILTALVGSIIGAIFTWVVTYFSPGSSHGEIKIPTFEGLVIQLGAIYDFAPVPFRIAYYAWITLFILYAYADRFDRLHCNYPRKVKDQNFRQITIFILSMAAMMNHLTLKAQFQSRFPVFDGLFPYALILGYVLLISGFYIIFLARPVINGFWGPHLYEYDSPEHRRIVTKGIYSRVRHPIYLGQILMSAGTAILSNSYIVLLFPIWVVYSNGRRANKEERYLTEVYGATYITYQEQVGKWLPKINR